MLHHYFSEQSFSGKEWNLNVEFLSLISVCQVITKSIVKITNKFGAKFSNKFNFQQTLGHNTWLPASLSELAENQTCSWYHACGYTHCQQVWWIKRKMFESIHIWIRDRHTRKMELIDKEKSRCRQYPGNVPPPSKPKDSIFCKTNKSYGMKVNITI